MKIDYNKVVGVVAESTNVIKATKFISPTFIVRATRRRFDKKISKTHKVEISLTVGKPNFLERKFIKDCIKAKEPFPIKKVQVKLLK